MKRKDLEKQLELHREYDRGIDELAPGARAELFEIFEVLRAEDPTTMDRQKIAEQASQIVLERVKGRSAPKYPDSMYRERVAEIAAALDHPLMLMMMIEQLAGTLRDGTQDPINALDDLIAILKATKSE